MKKGKRLYEMGGDVIDNFYPSRKSGGSVITPEEKKKAKEKIEQAKTEEETKTQELKRKYGPNIIINKTNLSKAK